MEEGKRYFVRVGGMSDVFGAVEVGRLDLMFFHLCLLLVLLVLLVLNNTTTHINNNNDKTLYLPCSEQLFSTSVIIFV